ncbi:MAG: preprotein translocase subunit SecG [Acidobacteria bacterium]|nr:MAG: preprotein translocase subunit SecG [Acidobacteriota bacterium]
MYILITLIHIVVCLFLIIVILLQSGKAADLAGAFGGMGSQTAFGPRGSATLLSKATTISAILFMCTSLALSILATRSASTSGTVLERKTPTKQSLPAGANPSTTGAPPIRVTPSLPGGKPAAAPQQTPAPAKK